MERLAKIGSILVLLFLVVVGSTEAQEIQDHTVTDQELRSAVQSDAEAEARDRALVDRVLSRDEVRDVAEDAGLDLKRAQDAVGLLEGSELDRVASLAVDVEDQLAGGQSTITVTTTTIIIVLLVLILIIVA